MNTENTNTNAVKNNPNAIAIVSWKLEGLEASCLKKNNKLEKLGYGRPLAIKVVGEWTRKVLFNGVTRHIPMTDVIVEGPSFVSNGAELVAVIDHMGKGLPNVVRIAGTNEVDPSWHTAAANCDHCKTKRNRNRTILVREASGNLLQVGASCVCAYTGHGAASSVLSSFYAMYSEAAGSDVDPDELGGGSSQSYVMVDEFLAAVIITTENGKFYEAGDSINVHRAWVCINRERDKMTGKLHFPEITDADIEQANALVTWAKGAFSMGNNYEANMLAILSRDWVEFKHMRLLASLVASKRRADGKAAEVVAAPVKANAHVGVVGERSDFADLTLVRAPGFASDFGWVTIYCFEDANGNAITWKTGKALELEIGDKVSLKATVKKHGKWNETNQTELTRAKVIG